MDNNFFQNLLRVAAKSGRTAGDSATQFFKNLITYSLPSQATRDTIQNIRNVSLANQVKRAEVPDFTTEQLANMGGSENFMARPDVQSFQNQLAQSQEANRMLQSELANPTANATYNRIFNVSPEEQRRQSGEQMYGITKENPQGKFFSPTATRDMVGGAGMALGAALPGMTGGMAGVPRAFTNILGQGVTAAAEGFGGSTPNTAGADTLIAGLLGAGGTTVSELLSNPEFRQFIKDKNSGSYDAYMMTGDEIGNSDTKTGKTYQDMISDIQNDTTPQGLIDEAKKYKSADEFARTYGKLDRVVEVTDSDLGGASGLYDYATGKKTVNRGAIDELGSFVKTHEILHQLDTPLAQEISELSNTERLALAEKLNYIAGTAGYNPSVLAKNPREMSAVILQEYTLNHNELRDVLPGFAENLDNIFELRKLTSQMDKSQLIDIWNKAQDIPINADVTKMVPEPGTVGSPVGGGTRGIGQGNNFIAQGKPVSAGDIEFLDMLFREEDTENILTRLNTEELGELSDIASERGLIKNETVDQIRRRFIEKYPDLFRKIVDDNKPYHRK